MQKSLRGIGSFLIVGSLLCGIIAYERFLTTERTAQAIAESIDGVEFVSANMPIETQVAAFVGVVLLVAGIGCWWRSATE